LATDIKFIPAAVGIILDGEKKRILLIKRKKPPFKNMWSLPGGKIEPNEHVSQAILREVDEECHIQCKIEEYIGTVSEIVIENNEIARHHIIHLFIIAMIGGNETGNTKWVNLTEVSKNMTIPPSDVAIIDKMVIQRSFNYFDCVLIYDGHKYLLDKFKPLK
jgi:8-oxo-dGTP diphosphatase